MLLVKTYLGPSEIHGIGLFAAEFIPKGTMIWDLHSGFDLELTVEQINSLPEIARDALLHYGYLDGELWVICIDDARHMNHSDCPNTDNEGAGTIALRDIQAGEEMTCDYNEISDYTDQTGQLFTDS